MPDLVDALEAIRDAGQLTRLTTGTERVRVATLAVQGPVNDAIEMMAKAKLADADRDALRKYLYRAIGH